VLRKTVSTTSIWVWPVRSASDSSARAKSGRRQCYQQLRSIYHATPAKGRQIAIKVLDSFHSCPIPEVARLGRTLRAWKAQILAYFDTHGVSNGGTEAINLIIEKVRRLAHGFKDFDHYRLRILLAADGSRPYRKSRNHP